MGLGPNLCGLRKIFRTKPRLQATAPDVSDDSTPVNSPFLSAKNEYSVEVDFRTRRNLRCDNKSAGVLLQSLGVGL